MKKRHSMPLSTYKMVKPLQYKDKLQSYLLFTGEYLGLLLESFEESGEKFSCVLHGSPLK